MNKQITDLIAPMLLEALSELSEQDEIVKKCMENDSNIQDFINSLIAAIICISERELNSIYQIDSLLKANPKLQEVLSGMDKNSTVEEET
jgi:L-fucose mutarotase/ribose pyranase (RbsD/FucU family)